MLIKSIIGEFVYCKSNKAFENKDHYIHWCVDTNDVDVAKPLIKKAEQIYLEIAVFEKNAKLLIAKELVEFKNDFWPDYDEHDESLNWDDVNAGVFDVSVESFYKKIRRLVIIVFEDEIYCEFKDGDLFGGHRIHAHFDNDYKLKEASI